MLTEAQKQTINRVLEDYSELKLIQLSMAARTADIHFSVMPDAETNCVRMTGDMTWRDQVNSCIKFHLSGLDKIVISSHQEILPREFDLTKPASAELIAFLATLFSEQNIYEWNCFGNPTPLFCGAWSPTWSFEFQPANEAGSDSIAFFKERANTLWVIGLWFSDLLIDGFFGDDGDKIHEPNWISVEKLASKFPKRVGITT